jgi:hypothetical protein
MSRKKRNNLAMTFEEFTSRPCYVTDIAELLGEDPRTTKKRIIALGEAVKTKEWGTKFSPKQIKHILSKLGYSDSHHQKRIIPMDKQRSKQLNSVQ